jgi:hypothetical protein
VLRFGYNRGLPEGVQAAWGCRAIADESGQVDVVWDRTSTFGAEPHITMLLEHLQSLPTQGGWQDIARMLLRSGQLSTREDREVMLHEDDVVVIKANPQASHGYLYVCAYLGPTARLAEAES